MKDIVDKLREYHDYAETPSERKTFSAAIEEILYLRNERKKHLSSKSDTQGMNDIVERLRNTAEIGVPDYTNSKILQEAADKIERLREETDGGKADYCKSCGCQHENWNANYQRLTIRNDALNKENEQLREENNKMRAMHDEALLRALSVVATIRGGRGDE
jgi:hypothetical protein